MAISSSTCYRRTRRSSDRPAAVLVIQLGLLSCIRTLHDALVVAITPRILPEEALCGDHMQGEVRWEARGQFNRGGYVGHQLTHPIVRSIDAGEVRLIWTRLCGHKQFMNMIDRLCPFSFVVDAISDYALCGSKATFCASTWTGISFRSSSAQACSMATSASPRPHPSLPIEPCRCDIPRQMPWLSVVHCGRCGPRVGFGLYGGPSWHRCSTSNSTRRKTSNLSRPCTR